MTMSQLFVLQLFQLGIAFSWFVVPFDVDSWSNMLCIRGDDQNQNVVNIGIAIHYSIIMTWLVRVATREDSLCQSKDTYLMEKMVYEQFHEYFANYIKKPNGLNVFKCVPMVNCYRI